MHMKVHNAPPSVLDNKNHPMVFKFSGEIYTVILRESNENIKQDFMTFANNYQERKLG